MRVARAARDRMRRVGVLAAVGAAAVLIVSACGSGGPTPTLGPVMTASVGVPASATPAAIVPPSPVDGVLVHIDSQGLSEVIGFELRLADGQELAFKLGSLENGDQFPPGHLGEHIATSSPIRVWFRVDGPDLVVYRIEDAPAP